MRWILSACLLGGLSTLFRHEQWPFANWLNLAGVAVLLWGFVHWVTDARGPRASGPGNRSQKMDAGADTSGMHALGGTDLTPPDGGGTGSG